MINLLKLNNLRLGKQNATDDTILGAGIANLMPFCQLEKGLLDF